MSKFYCNNCEEEVTLEDGKCPKCNTNWKKIMKEGEKVNSIEKEEMHKESDYEESDDVIYLTPSEKIEQIMIEDIDNNINFFLVWGKVLKIICIIVCIILFLLSFILIDETDDMSLLFLIPSAASLLFAFIVDNQLKWKAYMLLTNSRKLKR